MKHFIQWDCIITTILPALAWLCMVFLVWECFGDGVGSTVCFPVLPSIYVIFKTFNDYLKLRFVPYLFFGFSQKYVLKRGFARFYGVYLGQPTRGVFHYFGPFFRGKGTEPFPVMFAGHFHRMTH